MYVPLTDCVAGCLSMFGSEASAAFQKFSPIIFTKNAHPKAKSESDFSFAGRVVTKTKNTWVPERVERRV